MRSEEEKKQPQTVPNRSVDDNGESLHQSLPQWGKGDHEVVDEVFLTPNRSQLVGRKCYNEWCGQSRTPVPTKIKGYAEEFSRTSVGVGAYDDPCKQPPTEPNRSVEINGIISKPCRGRRPRRPV